MQGWKGPCLARSPGVRVGLSRGCACRSHCNSDGGDMLSSASCRTNTTANRITRTEWCDYSSFARWTPNQRFEAGGARRLGNESFFSAPQLKREPLGRYTRSMPNQLDGAFQSLARRFLSEHPEIPHQWREVKSRLAGNRLDLVCGAGTDNEVFASLLDGQIA